MSITITIQLPSLHEDPTVNEAPTDIESESGSEESTEEDDTIESDREPEYPCTVLIYKIFQTTDPSKLYVGATRRTLAERISEHKSSSTTDTKKLYKHINSLPNKWDDMTVSLVHEILDCPNKVVRSRYERKWMYHLEATLNSVIPGALIDICNGDRLEYDARLYRKNPKFREGRLAHSRKRVLEKKVCNCGGKTSLSNLAHHRRSAMHAKYLIEAGLAPVPPPVKRARYDF